MKLPSTPAKSRLVRSISGVFAPPRQPVVRPVSQVLMRLQPSGKQSVFDQARGIVLNWMSMRAGRTLPEHAWEGQSFTIDDIGAQRTEAVATSTPEYWAARLDDNDKKVAQRVWTTEVALGEDTDGTVILGSRLQCVTRGKDLPFEPSIPRFVRDVALAQDTLLDGRKVSIDPWRVESDTDVDELVQLLIDPTRHCDVIVFALPDQSTDFSQTSASAEQVARGTIGAAHVAIISGPASYALSNLIGKEFSVFHQAVRTYRPRFNTTTDDVFRHPLARPHKIAEWNGQGPSAFQRLLIREALRRSISDRDVNRRLPPFGEVRRVADELRREAEKEAGSTDAELLALAEEEIARLENTLRSEREEAEGLIDLAETDRSEALELAHQFKSQNMYLRQRVDALLARLSQADTSTQLELPNTLEGFESWCHENLSGSVEVHNRAFQGAKKSQYEDPSLIYQALLILRDQYVPMRREGGARHLAEFKEECQKVGITEEGSISRSRSGEEGDTYFIRYGGQQKLLDRHLKKGTSRDQRHCFRLYFFYDDEHEQVVVGWLPSHLDTRTT